MAAAFLPARRFGPILLPWMSGAVAASVLSLSLGGALMIRFTAHAVSDQAHGAEAVLEFAPIVATVESRAQQAAVESTLPDQKAVSETEQVLSPLRPDEPDHPTEQTSPAQAEEADLRMASERTQQEADATAEPLQVTEAAAPQEKIVNSAATASSIDRRAEQPSLRETASDIGNTQEAGRQIASWQRAVFAHVARFKRYPDEARKGNIRGDVVVAFTLDRKGHVTAVRVVAASGSSTLDQAAVGVLQQASPLPAPPLQMRGESVELQLPLRFQLR